MADDGDVSDAAPPLPGNNTSPDVQKTAFPSPGMRFFCFLASRKIPWRPSDPRAFLSIFTKCALRLAPLVFVRPGELRKSEWRIPAARMKTRARHIIQLSSPVPDALAQDRRYLVHHQLPGELMDEPHYLCSRRRSAARTLDAYHRPP